MDGYFIIMISETQARKYCKEDISLIENYEQAINDNTQKWHCHHRRESVYTKKGLIEIGEYYHRPAIELIFMTEEEHKRFHRIGKHHSEKTKKKISESKMGNNNKPTKPILQYTKGGGFIKKWSSGIEASKVLDINQGHIVSCCQGERKSAGGFVWRYA